MATKNIVPRANNEGSIGTSNKQWNEIRGKKLYENGTDISSKYLPLAGGTMTGTITTSNGNILNGADTDKQYWISGGTPYSKGATLFLNGVDRTTDPGSFSLMARDTDGTGMVFKGDKNGSLTWNGNTILHSYNYSNYALPLSGGTLTGTTTYDTMDAIARNSTTDELVIYGGAVSGTNPCIALRCKEKTNEPGSLYIRVTDNSYTKILLLQPDGTFTWDGTPVVTAPNGAYITSVDVTLSGTVAADSWGDYSGTVVFPTGYSTIVGFKQINVPSPANMRLISFWTSGSSVVVRVYSVNARTDTLTVTVSVCK